MSYECRAHSGLHIDEPNLFLIATKDGEQVSDTEEGRTDLITDPYPMDELSATFFINCSHGDHFKPLPDMCGCGRTFMLMSHPTRDVEKKPIAGFGFDMKYNRSMKNRLFEKMRTPS